MDVDEVQMRIGELAKRASVSTATLRYYEELGLISPAVRTAAGYRVYGCDALGRLGFIKRAQSLGLSLQEIRRLVSEPAGSPTDQARLRHAVAHKLADTRRRITELVTLAHELDALQARLGHGTVSCGRVGDCSCWLPTNEEVTIMTAEPRNTGGCNCCGCTCPSDGACSCCGCPDQHCTVAGAHAADAAERIPQPTAATPLPI